MKLCNGTGEDCLNCKLEKCVYEMDRKERHSKTNPVKEKKIERRGRPKGSRNRNMLNLKPSNDISKVITEERRKLHLSQRKLAELVGLNTETIFRYENGLVYPQLDVAMRILDALGCEIVIQKKVE